MFEKLFNSLIATNSALNCPKCGKESKRNSYGEDWCFGCARLVNACICDNDST